MKHEALCTLLDASADRLTDGVLARMYQDAFWHARFGRRADIHGRKDGRYHIDYLIQALHAGDATIIENYARWLQQVLTTRGMCSRHLAENFELLGVAIAEQDWPEREVAVEMLARARRALGYAGHQAAEILAASAELVAAARSSGRPTRELEDLACYLADAIALADHDVLAKQAVFMVTFTSDRAGILAALRAMLPVLPGAAPALERAIAAVEAV